MEQEERDPIIDLEVYRKVVESELEALRNQNFKYRLMITQLKNNIKELEIIIALNQSKLENKSIPLTRPIVNTDEKVL